MTEIEIGGEKRPIKFSVYTAKLMYKISGVNLFDFNSLATVFKDGDITPDDMEVIAKFVYSALAGGVLPDDADDDWRPPFTINGVMGWIDFKQKDIFKTVLAAYMGVDEDDLEKKTKQELVEDPT